MMIHGLNLINIMPRCNHDTWNTQHWCTYINRLYRMRCRYKWKPETTNFFNDEVSVAELEQWIQNRIFFTWRFDVGDWKLCLTHSCKISHTCPEVWDLLTETRFMWFTSFSSSSNNPVSSCPLWRREESSWKRWCLSCSVNGVILQYIRYYL